MQPCSAKNTPSSILLLLLEFGVMPEEVVLIDVMSLKNVRSAIYNLTLKLLT